jgi:hypothetical protein
LPVTIINGDEVIGRANFDADRPIARKSDMAAAASLMDCKALKTSSASKMISRLSLMVIDEDAFGHRYLYFHPANGNEAVIFTS